MICRQIGVVYHRFKSDELMLGFISLCSKRDSSALWPSGSGSAERLVMLKYASLQVHVQHSPAETSIRELIIVAVQKPKSSLKAGYVI